MPAPVSQQAPLLQPQALGASGQQVPPATQSAEHLQPYVPVPPQVPAQEPWIWQAGMTLLPCGVHAVPGGQVLMVAQSPGLPDAMLFKQAVAEQIITSFTGISVLTDPEDPTALLVSAYYVPVFPLLYLQISLRVSAQSSV